MKRMSDYDLVRRLFYRQGVAKREISRRIGIHRDTIEKMLRYASPPGYRLSQPRSNPDFAAAQRLWDIGGSPGCGEGFRVQRRKLRIDQNADHVRPGQIIRGCTLIRSETSKPAPN